MEMKNLKSKINSKIQVKFFKMRKKRKPNELSFEFGRQESAKRL